MKRMVSLLMAAVMLFALPVTGINVRADNAGGEETFREVKLNLIYGESADLSRVLSDKFKDRKLTVSGNDNVVKLNGKNLKATGVGSRTVTVTATFGVQVFRQTVKVTVKPKKVTGLIAKRSAANNIDYDCILLQWDKQVNASYKIYRSTKKTGGYKCIGTLKNSYYKEVKYPKVQWLNKKVTRGRKYYYRVKAYCTTGSGRSFGRTSKFCEVRKWKKTNAYADYITLSAVNKIRKKKGLRPYLWDFRADRGAKKRVNALRTNFSHYDSDGKLLFPKAFSNYATYGGGDNGEKYQTRYVVSENISSGCSGIYAISTYKGSAGHEWLLISKLTEDVKAYYDTECESGKLWKKGVTIPGNVCGISCWTYVNDDNEGAYNCFVLSSMTNYSEGQKIPEGC